MKLFIFFFLVCAIQISFGFPAKQNENEISNVIKEKQVEVKKFAAEFEEFATRMVEKFKTYFQQEEKVILEKLGILKDELLKEIEKDLPNDVQKDENACYKIAAHLANTLVKNVTLDVRTCQHNEIFYGYTPTYNNLNFTVKMGKSLVENFDTIQESCNFFIDENACLRESTVGAEIFIKDLKSTMEKMRALSVDIATNVFSKTEECKSEGITSFKEKSLQIKKEVEECLPYLNKNTIPNFS